MESEKEIHLGLQRIQVHKNGAKIKIWKWMIDQGIVNPDQLYEVILIEQI